jgi:glycosyltransferase involved in cell wall biosynthesis
MRVLLVTKPLVAPWQDSGKIVPAALASGSSGRHELHVLVESGNVGVWPMWVRPEGVYRTSGRYRPGATEHLRMMLGVWARRGAFDLLHFFFQPHPPAVRAARWLARACGRRAVHTILSAPREASPSLLFAHRTVTLSRATADAYARAGARVDAVIPPSLVATDPAGAARSAAARAQARLEGRFVIYPGDFEFSGGHDLLLDVWGRTPAAPTLLMTGRAKTSHAAAARAALEADAVRRGLAGRVRFEDTVHDMPALIAASEALLFPARSLYGKTDLPLVILEAWRESRPVLASDLPPLIETIGAGGLALPPDPAAWAAAIEALGRDGPGFGRAGRAQLETRYDARVTAAAYEALYDDAVHSTTPAGRHS